MSENLKVFRKIKSNIPPSCFPLPYMLYSKLQKANSQFWCNALICIIWKYLDMMHESESNEDSYIDCTHLTKMEYRDGELGDEGLKKLLTFLDKENYLMTYKNSKGKHLAKVELDIYYKNDDFNRNLVPVKS